MVPAQMHDTDAGKEREMAPIPRHKLPSYKSAGKLQPPLSRLQFPAGQQKVVQGKVAQVTGVESGAGHGVGVPFAQEGATAACTHVSGLEGKDAGDTVNLLNEAKTVGSQDPLKIPVGLGYDINCKKVIDAGVKKPVSLPLKSLNHISRNCRELNASVNFYEHVLGFVPIKRPGSFDFDGSWLYNYGISIHLLQAEDDELGSMPAKKEEIKPRDDHISFQCEDLLLVEATLKGIGLKYTSRVIEEGGIMVEQLFFHDPDGFMIEVCTCDKLPVQPLIPVPLVRYPSRKRLANSSSTASFFHQMLQAEPLQTERRSIEQFAVSA